MNAAMYEHMYGPNEFTATGTEKAYDLTDRLNRLTVPVLLLCGRHDEARPEDTAFSRDRIRDAEFVVFDRSSHMPHLEEPALFLQVLRTFLARAEVAEERTS
jgi:pimeloyl-ACP methyl ester carboxylesterase